MALSLEKREDMERAFWVNDPKERPGARSVDILLDKMGDAKLLLGKLKQYNDQFSKAGRILEIGGGQLWGSCLVKRLFPDAHVTGTDIAPAAIESAHDFEEAFGVSINARDACTSNNMPFEDESFDLVFTFAAAHHFGAHRKTAAELGRILRPGGTVFYFHEPACKPWIYKTAHRRVNAKRPVVPEDVLVIPKLIEIFEEAGFAARADYAPTVEKRGRTEYLYYLGLQTFPAFQKILPCTVDFVFTKSGSIHKV